MKKIILLFLIFSTAIFCYSQDLKKVETALILKQPETAKTELDKAMSDQKAQQNPDAWFYKAWIYSSFYKDPKLRAKYPNAEVIADEAFNKYMQLDTSHAIVKQYGAEPFFDEYATSFTEGIRTFNDKKWDSAVHYFGLSVKYSDIIFKNKWNASPQLFDTSSIQYAGYAYQNEGKTDDALKYYERLADAKVGGKDFMDIYRFMLDYYSKNKNGDKFKQTIAEVRQLYPDQSAMWDQYEMENMTANTNIKDIYAKFKQEDATGKLSEDELLNYAEALAQIPKEQLSSLDSATQVEYKLAAAGAYKQAFNYNHKGLYAYNAGVLYYNVFGDLDDRYNSLRGAGADLKVKRTEVEKMEYVYADSSLQWLETGYNILKDNSNRSKIETVSLNRTVDFLANLYYWKREKSKGVKPADYDKYNTKYTLYDSEHDKYK